MNYEKILNEALQELAKRNEDIEKGGIGLDPPNLLKEEKQLTKVDRHLILKMFVKDGYATDEGNESYWITFLGKMFIKRGGYERKATNDLIKWLTGKLSLWAIILGGGFAALYYLKELLVWLELLPCK